MIRPNLTFNEAELVATAITYVRLTLPEYKDNICYINAYAKLMEELRREYREDRPDDGYKG